MGNQLPTTYRPEKSMTFSSCLVTYRLDKELNTKQVSRAKLLQKLTAHLFCGNFLIQD